MDEEILTNSSFLVLSGKFSFACESEHSFIKAFIDVRITKSGRQFVQPQVYFRRNSNITTHLCSDVLLFATI